MKFDRTHKYKHKYMYIQTITHLNCTPKIFPLDMIPMQ